MMVLEGKRILVTGATSGIGKAISLDLARNGATVGIHHRRESEAVASEIAEIQAISPKSVALRGDLTQPGVSEGLMADFTGMHGGIDGLVNNAGAVYDYGDFLALSREAWEKTLHLNATAPFELMRAAWPWMVKANYGRIVNISSAAVGYAGSLRSVHYVASKAALEALTRTFSKDGAKHNILVNALRLGLMDTPMHTRTPGYTQTHLDARASIVPLGRMGQPEEAAAWVRNLLGPDGDFMTGQIISLSGGD
jgi:3-oxoacyl-[acyl-carrier protein] reductase